MIRSYRFLPLALCLALAASSLPLSGCALLLRDDPDPKPLVAEERLQMAQSIKLAREGWPEAQWWLRFEDAQLTGLIEQALANSPGMDVARGRTELAKAKIGMVKSVSGPTLGAMGMVNRMRVSDSGFMSIFAEDIPALGISGPWYTTATTGLTGSWRLDIWGKDRAQIRSAAGAANAQRAEEAMAELVLASGVARLYFDLQTMYGFLDLLKETSAVETQVVAARKARLERGLDTRMAYEEARLRKLGVDEKISDTQNNLRIMQEAMRALIGLPQLPAIEKTTLPAALGTMPESLGYELLARRADLQSARWQVEASLDKADSVRAAFYPNIDIKAFFGFDSLDASDLFHSGAQQIMLTPVLSLPIFDSGRLNAALGEARAASDMTIAIYNETVLNAVRDVTKAGIGMQKVEARMDIQSQRLQSAAFMQESAQAYASRGLLDNVSALEARLPLLLEQGKALDLRRAHLEAEITLIQALGGGYEQAKPDEDKKD